MKYFDCFKFIVGSFFLLSSLALAQRETYVSQPDQDLLIQKWSAISFVDNTKNIYAQPLSEDFKKNLEDHPQFEYVSNSLDRKITPEDFEENPQLAQDFLSKNKVDAFWVGRIAKGPNGLNLRLTLFAGKQGLPLFSESKSGIQSFDIKDLKNEMFLLYSSIKNKIPYKGLILSRRGQQVTLNLGKSSGIFEGQTIESIQILNIQRHPRFHVLTSAEKEIMGKILITKVDDKISFGTIVSERTAGQLQPGSKINYDQFVNYPGPAKLKDGSLIEDIKNRADSDVAFGSDPKEWTPAEAPTFGQVALLFGLGNYTLATSPSSGTALSSQNNLTPSFHVESEMWISSKWFFGLELHQYVAKIQNDLNGSSPSSLDLQTLETELFGGYNVLTSEEFWGPKFQFMLGMTQMDSKIQDSSPTAYTSNKYGGLALGLGGSLPLSTETKLPITVGGKFMYYWNPTLSESPVSSGSSSTNRISAFLLNAQWQKTPRLAYKAELSFRQYNSNFSGSGSKATSATSLSHATTTLAGGLIFMF